MRMRRADMRADNRVRVLTWNVDLVRRALMLNNRVLKLTVCGMLIAIGIAIPMFSPLKVVLEPASFTLASHVAIFIAMFISPAAAAAVTLGTTLGFFLAGFPLVVVIRAASHIVFALCGALYLRAGGAEVQMALKVRLFSLGVALAHGACEAVVAGGFYFSGAMSAGYYQRGFEMSVLLLVGVGTVIHSMVDFEIAGVILRALRRQRNIAGLLVRG